MTEAQLLLWGETQVGKTTLLAAGLLARPGELPEIDWAAGGERDGRDKVLGHWHRLRRNLLLEPTSREAVLTLTLRNGNRLTVRDVRGGDCREPFRVIGDPAEGVENAAPHGVLFVTEWEGQDVAQHMAAVEAALPLCRGRKVGLAITKCEKELDADDPGWRGAEGWWREHDCWRPYAALLASFGRQVWATSAYGHAADGRPACLLGEFGQVMPYQVEPRNVAAPFAWFFKELGLW
jgi:hypothetical protein